MELIVDDEIILKTLQLKDVESRYKAIDENRAFLKKWLGWLDFYKKSGDLLEYTKVCQEREKKQEAYVFGIYYLDEFVGSIEIQEINFRNKKCEIGYWLSEKYNGKGIMIRSCKTIINYIFDNIGLNRISILVATENYESQAIPEKLGFIKEGTLKNNECLYGNFVDNYIYGMTKKIWSKN
jgi:ribosomal-protein-serine acetyltransferase